MKASSFFEPCVKHKLFLYILLPLLGVCEAWIHPWTTRNTLICQECVNIKRRRYQSPPTVRSAIGQEDLDYDYSVGGDNEIENTDNPHFGVSARFVAGLSSEEWAFLRDLLQIVANELGVYLEPTHQNVDGDNEPLVVDPIRSDKYHGTTGRVLLLQPSSAWEEGKYTLSGDDIEAWRQEVQELFCSTLRDLIDQTLYSSDPEEKRLVDPILVSFVDGTTSSTKEDGSNNLNALSSVAHDLIEETIAEYDMARPLTTLPTVVVGEDSLTPTQVIEVDGAFVQEPFLEKPQWDTSLVAVFDNLVNDELRKRLLTLIGGSDGVLEADPAKWARGALQDVMDPTEDTSADTSISSGFGLTPEAIHELCLEETHDAVEDMQSILTTMFPDFHVTRLSSAVMGEDVSPLTANAPMHGDTFCVHIDGDPAMAPPSPWTDVFGRYPNRSRGKPRFVTCLIYLNGEWDEEWGAETLFWDVASDTEFRVSPRPGRCLLMDQDVSHSVSAPSSTKVGPRYSLVWKLILHPRREQQDMRDLTCGRSWDPSTLLGSAAGNGIPSSH